MYREIKIEKLAYGGEGIGYLDGKVWFVENALPGETVPAQLLQDKKNFARAKMLRVDAPSPHRVSPPCPYVNKCGGCQYQHLEYSEEVRWKEIQVREHLERNLKIDPALVRPIVPSPREYGYRSSVTLHKAEDRLGLVAKDNKTMVPIENCLLADPGLETVFQKAWTFKNTESVTFRISQPGKIYCSVDDSFFEIQIGDQTLITHSRAFFQNNLAITDAIARKLRGWIETLKPDIFLDLYSGVGTFGFLSAEGTRLACFEENPKSIEALKKNQERSRRNAFIEVGRAEKTFAAWFEKTKPENPFIFLDPPRTGLEPRLTHYIEGLQGLKGIGYLSCHLGSLTRDLGILIKNGRFQIQEIIPFDMFPRTKHIEILALLTPRQD